MRASIAAVVGALLWVAPASADQVFQGTSQDLSSLSGGGAAAGSATVTIHRGPGGKVTDITISDTNGALVHTGSANAAAGFVADPLTRFAFAPQGWAIASYLNFSSFGTWISPGPGGSTIAGAAAGGRPTPAHAMPTAGTATYQGKTFGVGVESAPALQQPLLIWGDASITADFSHRQVTTDLTNLMGSATAVGTGVNPVGTATALGSLSGTASLSGNAYSGTLSGSIAAAGSQIPVSGVEQGRFFGPKAPETAGTWAVSGSVSTPFPAGFTAVGSFGAVRKP